MIGIYKITNQINGKIYVGQSKDIEERFKQHIYKSKNRNELGYNQAIHLAFRKYGIDNFNFEIIEETSIEKLDERERFWIKELNSLSPNGYNILNGGQLSRKPIKKILCSNCGKELKKSTKTNLCLECYKKSIRSHIPSKNLLFNQLIELNGNFTKMGEKYGVNDNTIRKWCKSYNLPYHSSNYQVQKEKKRKKPIKKSVYQIDKNTGKIIQVYESTNDAARALGKKTGSHITEVCNGKLKTCYGYVWKYVD